MWNSTNRTYRIGFTVAGQLVLLGSLVLALVSRDLLLILAVGSAIGGIVLLTPRAAARDRHVSAAAPLPEACTPRRRVARRAKAA